MSLKPWTLVLILLSSLCHAQKFTIKEIKKVPNKKFDSSGDTAIVYPIIMTKNPAIAKLINKKIRKDFFYLEDERLSLKETIDNGVNEGLVNLYYEIPVNNNGIFSLILFAEGCGAYCSSWNSYFNFDLNSGKSIAIGDLIDNNKLDSFKKQVFADKIDSLNSYTKEEKNSIVSNSIDSEDYKIIEGIVIECKKSVQIDQFILRNNEIEIIDPCDLPHVIQSQTPTYELKYKYRLINSILNPKFRNRLLN